MDNKNKEKNKEEKKKRSSDKNKRVKLLLKKFIIVKSIGSGSFGKVYMIKNRKDNGFLAAKVENRKKSARVYNEYGIYSHLNKQNFKKGLPKVYDFFQTPQFNIMLMQLLGPSLDDLFEQFKIFSLPTGLLLGYQLVSLLENLHQARFIHRDIKPNNFLIGRDKNMKQVYIMDFGLSKKYKNRKGVHIPFKSGRSLIGTARYASVNMHMGLEPSRRDDLESVGYMLVYFLKGRLPWQGLKRVKGVKHIKLIGKVKMSTSLELLCEGLPDCFKQYLEYCRNLKFDEDPDYSYMKNLFIDTCKDNFIMPEFEWITCDKL